jgi:hypothetical protein
MHTATRLAFPPGYGTAQRTLACEEGARAWSSTRLLGVSVRNVSPAATSATSRFRGIRRRCRSVP